MKENWVTELKRHFGKAFIENRPLAPLTTMKVGGAARGFLTVTETEELKHALQIVGKAGIPYLVLGKGANLIVPDAGFPGLVIQLKGTFESIRLIRKTRQHGYLRAGAGCSLTRLLETAAQLGLSGLEPLTGIPASIGGAVRMNAGIPGFSLSEALTSLNVLHPEGRLIHLPIRRLKPAYRDMGLPASWIVLTATFRLTPRSGQEIREKMAFHRERRRCQTWQRYPNAGSIFRNPLGDTAGRLIEACGLKGHRIGDAEVSTDHANVIVNRGRASAGQVLDLIDLIQNEVWKKTGIRLDLEVVIARN